MVTSVDPTPGFLADANPVSAPNYLAWRDANHVFTDMAAADEYRTVSSTSQVGARHSVCGRVSQLLQCARRLPAVGRTFSDGEDQPGRDHVVILSNDLWERQFGSDASLIGRMVRLNREDYTVIGVMPSSFRLLGFTPHLWTPLVLTAADQTPAARKDRSLFLFARLKPRRNRRAGPR